MCNFPARQLLEYAHEVVIETDPDDKVKLIYACGFMKTMGDLARYHDDLTGCPCWDDALVEMGWLDPKPGVMR
jgi:hypothetical protein